MACDTASMLRTKDLHYPHRRCVLAVRILIASLTVRCDLWSVFLKWDIDITISRLAAGKSVRLLRQKAPFLFRPRKNPSFTFCEESKQVKNQRQERRQKTSRNLIKVSWALLHKGSGIDFWWFGQILLVFCRE